MKVYPSFKYKKHVSGFEAVLVKSEEHHKAYKDRGDELFDSPADFGFETHPNPHEIKPKPAKPKKGEA